MDRTRYHHNHRRHRHRGPLGRPLAPMLILAAVILSVAGTAALAILAMLVVFVPLMLAGVGTVVVIRYLGRRRTRAMRRRRAEPSPVRTATTRTTPPVLDWRASRTRFAQLRSEYGQFECDPLAVLRLPALADVTVPSTSRFVETFAEAQALDTDTEPSAEHRAQYAAAVDRAWHAWHAARDAAERIRHSGIPAQEHASVQRAIKLLTMGRDSDHDAERICAYAKARTELAKLERKGTLLLPPAAGAALDAAARGQLPAARTRG